MQIPRIFLFSLFTIISHFQIFSQCNQTTSFPSKCVLIESILVDACSNPEGANEMIKIRVGKDPISISDITISWPNNPWRGFANEAETTPLIAELNDEVTSCGKILYPQGGILPPGAQVLIFCSSTYQMGSHSFAGLVDTIYVLFQNTGNTNGHFANYVSSGSLLRTTTISVSGVNGCSDVATYDRSQLVTQNGTKGGQDGGTVLFFENATPEYINVGCAPPIEEFDFSISANKTQVCSNDSINLNGLLKGQACVKWHSDIGFFNDSISLNTTLYLPSNLNLDSFKVYGIATPINCQNEIIDSLTIIIHKKPEIWFNMSDSINVCGLDSIDLSVSSSVIAPTYTWKYLNQTVIHASPLQIEIPSNNLPFYISASIQYSCGVSTDSIYLYSENSISVFAGVNTTICLNQNLILNGVGNGNNPTWFTNGNGLFTDSNAYTTSYIPSTSDVGQITIYLKDENNCGSHTDSFKLNIQAPPNPFFISDTLVCENESSVILFPNQQGGVFSGMGVNGNTFIPPGVGLFTISHFIGNSVCGDSFKRNIRVVPAPVADFYSTPSDDIKINTSVDFINNSIGANLFEWLINSDMSFSENESYFFDKKGIKSVRLVVFDSITGCSDTIQKNIEIVEDIYFYIGNTFTPNGDSLNDRFIAVASGYLEVNMYIYNRWGELLFKTDDATINGWDGTYMDRECPGGVYIYIVEMKDRNNKDYRFNGTLQLIR